MRRDPSSPDVETWGEYAKRVEREKCALQAARPSIPRPSEGPLVTAGEARAAATRAEAARWQYVTERWHDAGPLAHGTPPPERFTWQRETVLEAIRKLGRLRLEGQRW